MNFENPNGTCITIKVALNLSGRKLAHPSSRLPSHGRDGSPSSGEYHRQVCGVRMENALTSLDHFDVMEEIEIISGWVYRI